MHQVVITGAAESPSADTTAERSRWLLQRPHPHSTLMHEMKGPPRGPHWQAPLLLPGDPLRGVGYGSLYRDRVVDWQRSQISPPVRS
jgi:hypothetical protein